MSAAPIARHIPARPIGIAPVRAAAGDAAGIGAIAAGAGAAPQAVAAGPHPAIVAAVAGGDSTAARGRLSCTQRLARVAVRAVGIGQTGLAHLLRANSSAVYALLRRG